MSPETRAVTSLALLYSIRMLGLFMVLPVLMLFGGSYEGSSPATLGLALGIYGLTQAVFQIPLGLLSDILGRKFIISIGLVIFVIGSIVAATSDTVFGLIVGRALQGSGAIASAIMALVADLTSEESRTKAMAAIGASIGISFAVAIVLGPAIAAVGGIEAIFYVSAGLAFLGLAVLLIAVPNPPEIKRSSGDTDAIPALLASTIKVMELARLNVGIFSLHTMLMACFVAVPFVLKDTLGLPGADHWKVYLPVLLGSFVVMLPFIIYAEKTNSVKSVFIGAIATIVLSLFGLYLFNQSSLMAITAIFVFFVAFNFLEASLPSLVSKIAPARSKGTAMGIYSTSQFMGAFVGGVAGGWIAQSLGITSVFIAAAALGLIWLVFALGMKAPKALKRMSLDIRLDDNILTKALAIEGVEEASYVEEEGRLYLKVDKHLVDHETLKLLLS